MKRWSGLSAALTLAGMMQPLLSEGDLDRGRPPDVGSAYFHCGIVDPAIGAVCTKRLYGDGEEHHRFEAPHGGGKNRRLVAWSGEAGMVVGQGRTWMRVPGIDFEVAAGNRPVALRY